MKNTKQQPKDINPDYIAPLLPEANEGFFNVVQNSLTGQFDSATKNVHEEMEENRHTGIFKGSKGRLEVTSSGSFEKTESGALVKVKTGGQILTSLNAVVSRVLLAMRGQLYLDGKKEGSINVKKYSELCDISYKKAKIQVRDALEYLYNTDIYDPETGIHCRVIQQYGEAVSNNFHYFTYSDSFYKYLMEDNKYFNEISLESFKINLQRHPNAYRIYLKFCERRRQNSNILSVETLLSVCSYPKYEDIKDSGAVERDIISQLEDDLNFLANFFMWAYCHENGKPRTTEEIMREARRGYNYSEWVKLNVVVQWQDETNYDIGKLRERYEKKQELKEQRALKKKEKKLQDKEAEIEKREKELQAREQASSTTNQREEGDS